MATDYASDTRDIVPLRIAFPDLKLPPGYADKVTVRAAQFMADAIRLRRYPPPVTSWFAEKVYLAAALAADTEGGLGGVPGLEALPPEPEANAEAAYVAAFAAAVAHYGAGPDDGLVAQATRFRETWLAHLAAGADKEALARGIARGEKAAALVFAAFPPLDKEKLKISPAEFRTAIRGDYPPLGYTPDQAWQFTPASGHLERRPFNDYVPVAPGIGLEPPLARVGREEATVPPFPPYASPGWWAALEAVAKYGGLSSACRTPGEALQGWFFEASTSGPPAEAQNAVTAAIAYLDLPTARAARAQFLTWSAMATAGILTWREKYRHDILRPVTAMNTALKALPGVPADWQWETFGPTPPFPSYPSGHASFTPAAYLTLAMILREYMPDPMALRVVAASEDPGTWSALSYPDGRSRALAFSSLGDLISAANESRGYLGIHWELDGIWGRYLGSLAALRTHQQLMRSPSNPTHGEIAFPRAPQGALDDPAYNPRADWPGVTRSWTRQFTRGLAEDGRDPAAIVAFPELAGVQLPWPNTCVAGGG